MALSLSVSKEESCVFSMGNSRPLFLYFRLFNTVEIIKMFDVKVLQMTGFEPRTSVVASGCGYQLSHNH